MRRPIAALVLALAASSLPLVAQAEADAKVETSQASKLDALLLYRQGRDLETAGKQAEAQAKYAQSAAVCDQELATDPRRVEAYVVKCWSIFRLGRYGDVISVGLSGLKVSDDPRISEVMGEAYYYIGQMDNCLKFLQRYLDATGDSGDRGPTALFFMGEVYLKLKKYSHADIAYSAAVAREPNMPRWWFRLGNALESLGDWKRALDAYNKALALSPSYAEAQAAQVRAKAKTP